MELFEAYLEYSDYKELGGQLPLDVFTKLERKAQRNLDSFTFNRIKVMQKMKIQIPDEVKEVLAEFVNRMNDFNSQMKEGGELLTQYSNGVEQFSYRVQDEDGFKRELHNIAIDWLPSYLTNRLVRFDVERYLQRNNHDTKQA